MEHPICFDTVPCLSSIVLIMAECDKLLWMFHFIHVLSIIWDTLSIYMPKRSI